MVGVAVGQLRMSVHDALYTDINVILLADKANWDQLKACHGAPEEKKKLDGLSKEEAEAELKTRK